MVEISKEYDTDIIITDMLRTANEHSGNRINQNSLDSNLCEVKRGVKWREV